MNVSATWSTSGPSLTGSLSNLAAKAVGKIAANIYNEAVKNSPVLTGSFRSSWRMSLNLRDTTTTSGGAPGSPLPAPAELDPLSVKPGQRVIVSNSMPYAYRLEFGWSNQAPSGILRISVAAAIRRSSYV